MNRVVEIIEANHLFVLISFIAVTFYLLWTTNSKLNKLSKQVSDLKIKLGSIEKKQSSNSIDKFPEQPVITENSEVDEIVKLNKENKKLTRKVIISKKETYEYTYAKFYVNQNMYDRLNANPFSELKINVSPKAGKHPRGNYVIPNKIAKDFIRIKQRDHNWVINNNFHQDTVPTDLKDYFRYL